MKKLLLFATALFLMLLVFPKDSFAQQCINEGVTCCVLDVGGECGGSTFPGSCNSNCVATCPSNGFNQVTKIDGNCRWSNQPPGGGGGGGFVCPFTGLDCPTGTVRGSTLIGSQCQSYQCANSIGSAQQTGSCCDFYTPPRDCGPWYNCPTPSNPNKQCRDCTQEPGWCQKYNYETYNCVSVCSATAPTNVTFTPISLTAARLTWTPGTGGTTQYVYVGSNKPDVEANCASGNCAVSVNLGSAGQNSYDTPQVLAPGTVYYYRVVNSESISCATPSATGTHLQSCTLSPTSLSLSTSQTAVITASVGNSSEIQRVDFTSSNPSIASVSPSSDNSYPFTATVNASTTGSATITATVYYTSGGVACQTGSASFPGSQNTSVTVANLSAWWQVRDGDVQSGGSINSTVPSGNQFNLNGLGGYPGLPVYSTTTNLTSSNVSSKGWLANSTTTGAKLYNYSFFNNQIPSDTVITTIPSNSVNGSFFESGGTLSYGYYWYRYTGVGGLNLTINSPINLGARRVILLVQNSNLTINGNINLLDGVGFFGAFVNGNTTLGNASAVDLEGIYMSDGTFSTGSYNQALRVRGAVTAYGGFNLARNLANNSNPAELFEYAPDQIILFPPKLSARKINWKEVAP